MAKYIVQIIMIYFNPLSMEPIYDEDIVFSSLKNSLLFLQKIEDKFLLCLPSNGPDLSICGGSSFTELIQKINDNELKALLITILTGSTRYIGEYPQDYIEATSTHPMPAYGIYVSSEPKFNIILSLHTNSLWMENSISLIKDGNTSRHINVPQDTYSDINEGIEKWKEIIKYIISKKDKGEGYLPFSLYIKSILPFFIEPLYNNLLKDPLTKINAIRSMAKFIADLNGYEYSDRVSTRNRSNNVIRDIFFHPELNLYISTDVAHGRFEVLNNSGHHVCEIDFDGKITKERDSTGTHNIIL